MVSTSLSRHASCASVELNPYRAKLAVDSCIVLNPDNLAVGPGWVEVLKVVALAGVHIAVYSFACHPDGLGIYEHHPIQL